MSYKAIAATLVILTLVGSLIVTVVADNSLGQVTAQCAHLNTLVNTTAYMYDQSCFVLDESDEFLTDSGRLQEVLDKCNQMPGIVDGHLPWMWRRSQIDGISEACNCPSFDVFQGGPHIGFFRPSNASLTDGQGWYLLGSSIDHLIGPVPDLRVPVDAENRTVHQLLVQNEPNRNDYLYGDRYGDQYHLSLLIRNIDNERWVHDTVWSYGKTRRALCQYDARRVNDHFKQHDHCKQLDPSIYGVHKDEGIFSLFDCAQACTSIGTPCGVFSYDDINGCQFVLLAGSDNAHSFCNNAANDGLMYIRLVYHDSDEISFPSPTY